MRSHFGAKRVITIIIFCKSIKIILLGQIGKKYIFWCAAEFDSSVRVCHEMKKDENCWSNILVYHKHKIRTHTFIKLFSFPRLLMSKQLHRRVRCLIVKLICNKGPTLPSGKVGPMCFQPTLHSVALPETFSVKKSTWQYLKFIICFLLGVTMLTILSNSVKGVIKIYS